MDRRTVAILGGGQLGRMIIEAANKLGIRVAILDPGQCDFCNSIPSLSNLLLKSMLNRRTFFSSWSASTFVFRG
jgi:phosphoribosylaminoimidazole carboxylase (NCAIR synthetase)